MTRCRTGWRSWRSPEKVLIIIAPQLVEVNSTRKADGTQYCATVLHTSSSTIYTPATAHHAACGGGGKRRWCGNTAGAEGAARKRARSRCPHGRERNTCKECGGAGLCRHQRRRRTCKECGGPGFCQHSAYQEHMGERERGRERKREKEKEGEREREREKERKKERKNERKKEREGEREGERESESERARERERERESIARFPGLIIINLS